MYRFENNCIHSLRTVTNKPAQSGEGAEGTPRQRGSKHAFEAKGARMDSLRWTQDGDSVEIAPNSLTRGFRGYL